MKRAGARASPYPPPNQGALAPEANRILGLISFCENGLLGRRLSTMDALSAAPRLFQRNTAHGRFGLFLYIGFAVGIAAPPRKGEALFHRLLEFSIIRWLVRIGLAKRQRAIEQRLLNLNQQRAHRSRDPVLVDERLPFFPRTVASRQHHRILRYILRAQFHPQRNAAHFPVVKLESRAGAFALVELHPNVGVD